MASSGMRQTSNLLCCSQTSKQPVVHLPHQVFFQGPRVQLFRSPLGTGAQRRERGQAVTNQDHQPAAQKCSAPGDIQQAPALMTSMTVGGVEAVWCEQLSLSF